MNVRQATIADLECLAPLFAGYRTFYGQTPDVDLAREFLRQRLSREQSVIFLAASAGKSVGFAQLYPSFSSGSAARIYILNDLYVQPKARGRGIGRALLAASVEYGRAAGAVSLTLSTANDNALAQALYESAGWQPETVFRTYNLPLA
ncbi:GNAT family N-acetyltransferase [Sphingomonas piscis]|uniref:GNAT family N-acetyltransferase n=1 Tax=Sphingomonas piscis TaxID=2714943 RepID=A0A6G7YRJ3_9SPHN|nr:GNAT family N-acetyltransferase [Sphingomonas piscis]QIK79360.1 GNAT family N-acetyltransferase [Sphingomonas piscis]